MSLVNSRQRIKIILLVSAFGLSVGGCEKIEPGGTNELKVWAVSEMVALTDRTAPFRDRSILADDGRTVSLFAAGNETVSFQLVIDASSRESGTVKIKPTPLLGRDKENQISAAQIAAFRMIPINVTKFPAWYLRLVPETPEPGSFYDALVPLDARSGAGGSKLRAGGRMGVWIDVSVPRNARPGIYGGHITISIGPFTERKVKVQLKVYDFTLPDARALPAVGGFDHRTLFREFIRRPGEKQPYDPVHLDPKKPLVREGLELMRQMMVLAHEHRLDLFDKQIRPAISRNSHGKLQLDWSDYDAIVRPYLDGSAFGDKIPCPVWPIPYSDTWPVPKYYGGLESPRYVATAAEVVAGCGRHFRAMDAEEQMFAWADRGEVNSQAFARFTRLAEIVKKTDPGIPVLCQLPTAPPAMSGWTPPKDFATQVDILAPPGQWLDPTEAPKRRSAKNPLKGVWLPAGAPPYLPSLSVLATPADVRALPWFAMKYRCTGLFLPEVLNWEGDVFHTTDGSESRLFYPHQDSGRSLVLPSVRLKRLRRGLQDLAYLWILQQRQRTGLSRVILNAMVRYGGLDAAGDHYMDPRIGGWVGEGETWIQTRRLLADEVQSIVRPKAISDAERIAAKVNWQRFTEKTSSLRVERVQAFMRAGELPPPRVTPDLKPRNQSLRATVQVSLYNECDRNTSCRLKVVSLPSGWKSIMGEYSIPRFPAGERREARLVVEGLDIPATSNGKIPVVLELTADSLPKKTLLTEVAFVVAGDFRTPPTIDGRLDDWPAHAHASAGDFRLLGRRGMTGSGLAKRGTSVFVMHDIKNLYFAFRCSEPTLQKMFARPTNTVHYEQLLASGEDMVEILLDPGAKASGPEDLYHILIKPNGVMIQEMGIRTNPPLGKTRPFALGAELAIGRDKGVWIVELKIPRSGFGVDGKEEFWGVNFMRFATQGMEASSWSGAERYFYNPRNLGTMFVMATAINSK